MAKKQPLEKEYDVIVVGTGPAGSTIAHRTSQAGMKVLILEKGAYHPEWLLGKQIPSLLLFDKFGLCTTKEGLTVARCITVGGTAVMSCGSASLPYPGMFEKAGLDLKEELEEAHGYMGIVDDFPDGLVGKNQLRLMEVANGLGYNFRKSKKFIDPAKCDGGACMKGCPNGAKWSGRVPVESARQCGAHLLTGAEVVRTILEQGEAVGVETKRGDKYYGKSVVLSAGGLASPLILMKSGIKGVGDKFGVDPLRVTYGFSKENPTVRDIDMGIVDDAYHESDGLILSPLVHTWLSYLAAAAEGGSYLPGLWKFGRAVGIMTKIKDDLGGAIYGDGSFSKPLTKSDWSKLDKGEEHASRILKAAGCTDIFSCRPGAAHPCASVRVGDHVDANFETGIKNLFVCDASVFPESMGLPCVWTCTALGLRMAKVLKKRFNVAG
jgi:choline dehydrogenase-like flavoprotein